MAFTIGAGDSTAALQALLDKAAATKATLMIPDGGHRLTSTGLGYASNARIMMRGDLFNDHGPAVGTHYCLTNRTGKRLTNVTILGQGGAFVGSPTDPNGATRKGLGIVGVDGFTVVGIETRGPLTGFAVEVKNATRGHLSRLKIGSSVKVPGSDGLHFFGACDRISGSSIHVASGDDALSFTAENHESIDAVMERITLSNMTLDSAAFSCIKFWLGPQTGRARISDIRLSNIKGRITQGPTGCPLAMQNMGVAQGCVIEDITITNADLDFGAATQEGPCAFLVDVGNVRLRDMTLRGRRNGQFLRAIRAQGLELTGDAWDTIPGNPANGMVQLEQCGDYKIDLVVRGPTGARLGSIKAHNTGKDTGTRYIGLTGS